ncbi:Psq-like protein [Staphylococcus caledonicus]
MRKNPRATHVYLNGERISLRNAAKKYNVPYTTLRGRYNRELRGPELLYGKGVYEYRD